MATLPKKATAFDLARVRAEATKPIYNDRLQEARRMTDALRANAVVDPEKMKVRVGR